MTYAKIGERLIPAAIRGRTVDAEWDGRASKAITCEMTHADAAALFMEGLHWSILYQPEAYQDPETGETVTPAAEEYDNSDYSVAGSITDHRDGTVTVKMGRQTEAEEIVRMFEEGVVE